jgi:hypothetical protein
MKITLPKGQGKLTNYLSFQTIIDDDIHKATEEQCREDLESGVEGGTLILSRAVAPIIIRHPTLRSLLLLRRHPTVVPFVWNHTNQAKWLPGPAAVSMCFTKTASHIICQRK